MKGLLSLVLPLVILNGSAFAQPASYENDVERIISTLASDEMRGRYAFGPEAWDAARFIASEFEQIGLETMGEDNDYFQTFPVYMSRNTDVTVTISGQPVPAGHVAGMLSAESLRWTSDKDVTVLVVGPEEDLSTIWRRNRRQGNTLLFAHPSHKKTFDQIRQRLPSETRTTGPDTGPNLVGVLSEFSPGQGFEVSGGAERSVLEIANVVGRIEGNRKNEIVLFSAHYDHEPVQEGGSGDRIKNGANDNASGTTAMIELARHFKALGRPERTLLFVGFTAEERGGLGSRHFSQQVNPEEIVAMFNIEMVGKPAVEGPNTAWITGFERSDFGTILQEAVQGTAYRFYADPYPNQNLFYRSDNATLARLGVPAHSISTTPIDVDPDYHKVSDEVKTLDLVHLANTIKAIAAGATLIVSGERTPSRVDPAAMN